MNYEVLNNEWNIQLIVKFVSKNQNTCDIGKRCLIRQVGPKVLVLLLIVQLFQRIKTAINIELHNAI